MARASWSTLSAARKIAMRRLVSRSLAERQIIEWMGGGELDWRCKAMSPTDTSHQEFWAHPATVAVNWEDSSAQSISVHSTEAALVTARAYGIEVNKDKLTRLMGPASEAVRFIADEFKRMCQAGEIKGWGISEVERELAQRLADAIVQKGLRAETLKPRSVGNRLRELGFWPPK